MAKLPGSFNADEHEGVADFKALPNGKYPVEITDTDVVRNSNDTGTLIKITHKVYEGEFKGRILWKNINYTHETSPQAQEIGENELANLLTSVGMNVLPDNDTEHLHGKKVMAKVTFKKATATQPEGNDVKMYYPVEGEAKPSKPKSSGGGVSKPKAPAKKSAAAKPKPKKKVSFD